MTKLPSEKNSPVEEDEVLDIPIESMTCTFGVARIEKALQAVCGVSRECSVPIAAVLGVFARENSQGLFFQPDPAPAAEGPAAAADATPPSSPTGGKPRLQIVK